MTKMHVPRAVTTRPQLALGVFVLALLACGAQHAAAASPTVPDERDRQVLECPLLICLPLSACGGVEKNNSERRQAAPFDRFMKLRAGMTVWDVEELLGTRF